MIADRTTETIAHFIGLFDLAIEQARMRDGYEEFTAMRRQADLGEIEALAVDLKAPHELLVARQEPLRLDTNGSGHGYDGQSAVIPPHDGDPSPQLAALSDPEPPVLQALDLGDVAPRIVDRTLDRDNDPENVPLARELPSVPHFFPGSVVSVTHQIATLDDSDTLGTSGFWSSLDFSASFRALSDLADTLHAIRGARILPDEIPRLADAKVMAEAMLAARTAASGEGADGRIESTTISGEAAFGLFLNGVAVDSVPTWDDLLPDHFRETSDSAEEAADALDAKALPDIFSPNFDFEDGHQIVTGGNYLVNEASIYSSWVDAPLMAIGGSWMQLDHISQVAVASNNDIGDVTAAPTTIAQIAEFSEESVSARWSPTSAGSGSGGPNAIFIDHIEGDLLISHNVRQLIDVVDEDHFSQAISAASSAFVLGDNVVLNALNIFSAGLMYDLIIVGGDLIQFTSISQTLVLADDDRLSGLPQTSEPAEPSDSSVVSIDRGNEPGQPNAIPGDEDIGFDAVSDPDPASEAAPDNLLVNTARIEKVGVDTAAEDSHGLSSVLERVDEGLESMREALLSNPLLSGLEQARVLKVDGDLIQSMIVEQITTLRDSDDIHVQGNAPSELEVISGSNALLNSAAIKQVGMDSTIMAAEDSYSDILIHQAQLIDELKETADQANELVSEAVAFLADDLQGKGAAMEQGIPQDGQIMTAVEADDLMASMLA